MGSYGRVLRLEHAPGLIVSAFVGRVPTGMVSLALVLFVARETGSYADAGLATGVLAVGTSIGMPLQGRLIDRLGPARVLVPSVWVEVAALLAVVALGTAHETLSLLLLACAVAGVATPALTPTVRMAWSRVTESDPGALDMALGLESALIEIFFTVGPLLTAVIVTLASPGAALFCVAALSLVGTLALAAAPVTRHLGGGGGTRLPQGPRVSVLRSPALLVVTLVTLAMGATFGAFEVGAPAFASHAGDGSLAGVALAANSIASMVGGLAYGAHPWQLGRVARFWRIAAVHALLYVPLLFVSSLAELVLFMALCGFAIAPLITSVYLLVEVSAPAGALTEAYGWVSAAVFAGSAVGSAVAGVLAHGVGVWAPFAASLACACTVAVIAFAASRSVLRSRVVELSEPV